MVPLVVNGSTCISTFEEYNTICIIVMVKSNPSKTTFFSNGHLSFANISTNIKDEYYQNF